MFAKKIVTGLSLLLLFILALGTRYVALSEPVNGQDYLALQQKNFNAFKAGESLKCCDATGNLDWTFGSDMQPVEQILLAKPKFHRVHFFNGACIRGGNCGPYEISRGYNVATWDKAIRNKNAKILTHLKNRVVLYRDACNRHPDTKCLASPELEHNLSKKAYRVLADTILDVWPSVQLVNSPVGGIQIESYRGAWIERHGSKPQSDADIVSTDGEEITDLNIPAFIDRTNRPKIKIRYAWSRGFNCRHQGAFQDPRKRTQCSKPAVLNEISHIFDERGPVPNSTPPGCGSLKPFKSPAIWKPLAEDNGTGDKRANKPVVLIGKKAQKLSLIASNGMEVGYMPLYKDPVPHTLERYYSALGSNVNGYDFEILAKQKSGSPYVYLKFNNACFGPIATGRRNGIYK